MSDAVKKFWHEWLIADEMNRPDKLEQLARMGLSAFLNKKTLENKSMMIAFCNLWNTYFEDFLDAMQEEADKK